jgi:hypothetical protein
MNLKQWGALSQIAISLGFLIWWIWVFFKVK